MASDKLRVGIAGYGIVGRRRYEFIEQNPHFQTVAVSDRMIERISGVGSSVRAYSDFRRMIDQEDLDVLFVCLTNDVAAEATVKGLHKGWHVFCEKPPARNLEELDEVVRVKKEFPSAKLKYGFNHRYHDSVREAISIVESGRLGKVVNMRGVYGKSMIVAIEHEWRSKREIAGGGILLDQGIHMADLMRLFGGEVKEVKSYVTNSYWNLDVEDNAFALIMFDTGVIGQLHSSATEWRHQFNLQINLTQGTLVLEGILSGTKSYGQEILRIFDSKAESIGNPRETRVNYLNDTSWKDEVNEFAECIMKNQDVVTGSLDDGYRTLDMVYRIYKADSSWKEKFNIR